MLRTALLLAIALSSLVTAAVAAQGPSPPASAVAGGGDGAPAVWLQGPFGRVPGGTADVPAVERPSGKALDTFVRRAPLELELPSGVSLRQVTSTPAVRGTDVDGQPEELSGGTGRFEGPSSAGIHVVVAEIEGSRAEQSTHAWLLHVPDRDPPEDGLYDIPAPDVVVTAGAAEIAGQPEDGCYLYLCVEIGRPAPFATLRALTVDAGEPLSARLSDGSAIHAWEGELRPASGMTGDPVSGSGGRSDDDIALVTLTGLEAPTAGDWLLTLRVVFDRDRGWMRTRYRLESR